MRNTPLSEQIHPLCWAVALFAVIGGMVGLCSAAFAGTFRDYVPVTLVSDRTGLVMESGAKVKMRGVQVGRVAGIDGGAQSATLRLEIFPDQRHRIPANVEAEIKATTVFGAKYVDLIYPRNPSPEPISNGAVLRSRNVTSEVNTVFDSLVGILKQIDVAKLNTVLTAVADGVRGKGQRMGEATTAANEVLRAVNSRVDTITADIRSFKGFSDSYSNAARDIIDILDSATTTAKTIIDRSNDLDRLLLNVAGFANSGTTVLAGNTDTIAGAINVLEPTTALLLKYNPSYTCTIQGAKIFLDTAGNEWFGGNGRTVYLDAGIAFGDDLYKYPDHLPIVAAKGGPGGKPGCGSLPDVAKNFPVRQLITNTGWGRGIDWRPNPGIAQTCAVDFFPVTRAVPEPPHIGTCMPGPAPGPPPPYPGGPPYGAPWYGPDGTPLYPGVPDIPPGTAAAKVGAQLNPPTP